MAGWLLCACLGLLAACGGDSGGTSSTPAPATTPTATATPTPTPTPTATTTPAAVFQTAEYNRSDGAPYHNAIAAWQVGATGTGVTIGIVDSGIDTANPEFSGRISPLSTDVTGLNRGLINADSDHGTDVALTAAAARDNSGVLGIAWNARLFMARADSSGSCATTKGCSYSDTNIAAGLDAAVAAGARVVNISLGGDPAAQVMKNAIARAATAGVLVVVSAGNDATANPDPFAMDLRAAGNGNVIIAGSVDKTGTISTFSDQAGSEAQYYLAALGDSICCTYQNGQIKITIQNGQRFVEVFSGTSFSAPQIAGAAALLFQAFPSLTATQVVDLLLKTARDAGATGTDPVYGRGILDIAAAFAPQGGLALPGGTALVALGGTTTSTAMGDAAGKASLPAVALDSYGRAYRVDLASGMRGAGLVPHLAPALASRAVTAGGTLGPASLALSIDASPGAQALPWRGALRLGRDDADMARVLAGRMAARIAPQTTLGFAYVQGADGLVAQLSGASQPAFLVAGGPVDDPGFQRQGLNAVALRRQLGRWGLTVSGESGRVARPEQPGAPALRASDPTTRFGLMLDRRAGPLELTLGASWLRESGTLLGARFNPALGLGGAETMLADAGLALNPGGGWRLAAALRQGWSRAHGAMGTVALSSRAWSLDASLAGMWRPGDSLALRLAQPMRIERGGIDLLLPVSWSYATRQASFAHETLNLAPQGRELDAELAYRTPLLGGSATANLFWRREPGHYATLGDEAGVALGWQVGF
ncbi:MAG: S8 family serine peptidase [Proteobacteria bacterium]|nr:S8 family serine peptidase [Pseudomonadota bacterium]